MTKHVWHWALPAMGVLAIVAACGGDDDDGGNGSGGGGTGGGAIIVDPNDPNAGNYEGGTVDLTPEQAISLIEGEGACTGWAAEPEGGPATLMMVVDTSLSMASAAPNSGDTSKWEVTREALLTALDSLTPSAWVGLMFYPNEGIYGGNGGVDLTECVNVEGAVVPSALGGTDSAQRQTLVGAIEGVTPNGCTPTHGAYVWGLNQGLRAATQAPGEKHIVIITDGQPTLTIDCATGPNGGSCSPANPTDKDAIQAEIAAAMALDQTRTWIIGSPGSEANETTGEDVRAWLSEAAEMGGTALAGCDHDLATPAPFCHFDMSEETDFSTGLQAALTSISGQIVGCEYDIPPAPTGLTVNRDQVNLIITNGDGQNYLALRDSDPACDVGWYYEGDRVMLCSQTCADVENDAGASLNLMFGCASNEIPEVR